MPNLKIIKASAGSGKTFSLTREYLRLLYAGHDNFMHILAVTFTNKATEEMKSRIIEELSKLSSSLPSKHLKYLTDVARMTEEQVRSRAKTILGRLLHRYSGFSVNTIDTFFQKIIRGFTRELGIQTGYSIEIETDILLSRIINRLLIQAENDRWLLSWLTDFAESKIERGESWDLKRDMQNLGKEIFREEYRFGDEGNTAGITDRTLFREYKSELHTLMTGIEKEYRDFGRRAAKIMESHGLTVDDFSSKSRGPAGFLLKLGTGNITGPNSTALSAAENPDKWYTAKSAFRQKISAIAHQDLMPLMKQFIGFYQLNGKQYHTAAVILKNLHTLGILSDLADLANLWCNENNAFLLSDAPVFLNRIINGNDTPFIYEKAGYWYHHFMIDEFQDTSLMQWANFKPLINNSLSQNYDNLTVGDAKQSVYRWRNSNWEIIENIARNDFIPGIIRTLTLKSNWRSKAEIISFNSNFFRLAASVLQESFNQSLEDLNPEDVSIGRTTIVDLYQSVDQEPGNHNNTGGYVRVDQVEDDPESDLSSLVFRKLIEILCELQDRGYSLNDVAILTRTNREGRQTADFLHQYAQNHPDTRYRFDVISDEALQLSSSAVVNFLITVLRYISDPSDKTNAFMLQWLLDNYLDESHSGWKDPGFLEALAAYSLSETVEQLILAFRLEKHQGEWVYLRAFRDMVLEYSRKNGSEVARFLEYWDESGKDKSVSVPSGQDAIRILTVHKSKGLEFRITIIPFCTWDLTKNRDVIIWCRSGQKPFNKFGRLPLAFSSRLKETCFAEDYYTELQRQFIDNLNLLYVAFTRAQDGLFAICKTPDPSGLTNISDLVHRVLGNIPYTQGTLADVEQKITAKPPAGLPFSPVTLQAVSDRVRIAFQGNLIIDPEIDRPSRPLNEGKLLHELFTLIRHSGDIRAAVERLHFRGLLVHEEKERYCQLVEHAIGDPQVQPWFSGEWHVLNEAEIILPGGGLRRPDRVMTRNGQTMVIDYKFGAQMEKAHEDQIREYASLLSAMGSSQVEACLWYVKLGKIVRCIL